MLKDLVNLFFPKVCEACKAQLNDNELVVCTTCRHNLPITNFHFDANDAVKKMLYGRVQLEHATALLHFSKKGMVQQLLHNLKYRGHEHIGLFFGEWLGAELATLKAYKNIDCVVPVPIHKRKLRQRGYNQVTAFAKAIAKALNADYDESTLVRVKDTKTQVFKNRVMRFDTSQTTFEIKNTNALKGKHILLTDDIITTGATIEVCATVLNTIKGITLSVATMAIAE